MKKQHMGEQGSPRSQLTDDRMTKLKGNSKRCQHNCPQSVPRARCFLPRNWRKKKKKAEKK